MVSTHGAPSSLKSAVRAESRAAWKQLQPHETGVVDRIRRFRKMRADASAGAVIFPHIRGKPWWKKAEKGNWFLRSSTLLCWNAGMECRCEDLPRYGVVLLPPSSPGYAHVFADIQERLANPVPGSAPELFDVGDPSYPTMVLCNRSQTAVAAVSWIWKWEPETGRPRGMSVLAVGVPSVLAPFGLDEPVRKLYGYWHVILPESKRSARHWSRPWPPGGCQA